MRSFLLRHRSLFFIILLSTLLKLLFVWQGEVVNPDSATYIAAAQKHAAGLYGEALHYYRMPFYPLLLAAVHSIIPDWIRAGQLLTIVPMVLCLWPLYLLTQRLFGERAAIATAVLFAVLPSFNISSTAIKRDPLFLLFSLSALFVLIVIFQNRRMLWWPWFFLLSVFSVLTRIEGILLPIAAIVFLPFLWFSSDRRAHLSRRDWIVLCLLPLSVLSLVGVVNVLGVASFLRIDDVFRWGKELLSRDFFSTYQALMNALEALQDSYPSADLHNNLIETTRHYAPLIYLIGLLEMLVKMIFPTSLIALWMQRRATEKPQVRERWILLFVAAAVVVVNLLFCLKRDFTTERYLWLAVICVLPWVGQGMAVCWQRYQTHMVVLVATGLLVVGSPLAKTLSIAAQTQDRTVALAGKWLQEYDPAGNLFVMYNDRRLPLYANRAEDVIQVRELDGLRRQVVQDPRISFLALYVSNDKHENCAFPGFDVVKTFEGRRKTALFLQRRLESSQ